ncbi:CHAT domain-containing protein [Ideonella sp. YS5]|uniref:CHAT domain-containing protein n=1 Tax=Ideonella sp. YS5 TaxID=3453714 RepID=UPI003EECBE0C
MARTITIQLTGREESPTLPPLLTRASRGLDGQPDPFLPADYLRPTATYDVGASARSAVAAATVKREASADELIVLELADGGTLVTSVAQLRETLERTHPDWLEGEEGIPLEKLRATCASPGRGLGEALGGLVSKVYTLVAGEAQDAVIDAALGWLKDKGLQPAELGVTWLGTQALMWAVESKLVDKPGVYHWVGGTGREDRFEPPREAELADVAAKGEPMLVFVHGTGSSSPGSFGDLRVGDRDLWNALERHFTGGIYGFEHHTLSASPIDNALQLARALPAGARLSLVSHSRGGLVADLLCLGEFDAVIEAYGRPKNLPGIGELDPDSDESKAIVKQLDDAYADQRKTLRLLAAELRAKKFVIERYVRAASPANGTKLASGNFDVFLSGLLTLIGQVPFFFGSPFYAAFKRVVIEIAKNRTNPHLVPGIEAMLPDSPMARLLRDAPVREGLAMSVIAGDIEGGNLLKRLGVLLTDMLIFDREDNDLVVNTPAMLAGIAPRIDARVIFDRGADVSHFRYFTNTGTRIALRDWLVAKEPRALEAFRPLPNPEDYAAALVAASRDALATDKPVVVVLPGVMGSHLRAGRDDRVWFDPLDIAAGGLAKIAWGRADVEADDLFEMFYGELCQALADSHRVERFAYDWRQPLDVLGERFGEFVDRLMKQTQQPIRLLAHSMGGLVVRACIHRRRPVMDALMARDGARLVMLGTPHQGAHSMVENLIGKGDTLRMLVRLDVTHSMQQVLDIVAGFRGALQLLPKPGFTDMFQGQSDGGEFHDYQQQSTWEDFVPKVKDFWFGNGQVGQPTQEVLDSAAWLWRQDGMQRPALPAAYEKLAVYVFGVARNTPCGVREIDGRLKMVGTTHGDGTVTWESGRIGGIGQFFYMPAEHGDLPATKEYFPALKQLLITGTSNLLSATPPAKRAIEQPQPLAYDAGPPSVDDAQVMGRVLLGGSARNRLQPRSKRRLDVRVRAMDLHFLSQPIMVGHYERDPIAGPQALIDRELLSGDLTERKNLGLYAGPLGTATVVLRVPNEAERLRGSMRGAIVTGLGPFDGSLGIAQLTEAVVAGTLRYLLQVIDVLGKSEREVPLATLLLGYNSSANLTVEASMEALVRGVMEGNARFYETTRLNIRVGRLDIVELYIDTAITAVYALRHLEARLAAQAEQHQTELVCQRQLDRGEGMRQRLFDGGRTSYWPRLMITGAIGDEAYESVVPASVSDAPTTLVADTLRFVYVGQRARAESKLHQRQPGLIEQLVRQQIHDKLWSEDFGRTLFQLMVPHDFKGAARQLDKVVLVVDRATANLPWELMLADDPTRTDDDKRPLSLRTAVVRQLVSTEFRRQVRQSFERTALVIGNPSVKGFAKALSRPDAPIAADPPDLPRAQAEAEAVARLLGAMGYTVRPLTGGEPANLLLPALYHQPWRILHISAHGVFGVRHPDGRWRSGVVLSDGLFITAAEIDAMEVVPDVVFLNCCHLGTVDVGRAGNKLAASIARQLIEIGVRCVVVAGWAVDDEGARRFGETFYEHLLRRRQPFGESVLEARKAVYENNPLDITWGAFQAYGDPAWRAEPQAEGGDRGEDDHFASPEELLDELARIRATLARRSDRLSDRDSRAQITSLTAMLRDRTQAGWLDVPTVQSALGLTWFDLGEFERARLALTRAVQAEDAEGKVPIHDIEKLANVEARLAERMAWNEVRAIFEPPAPGTPAAEAPAATTVSGPYGRTSVAAIETAESLIDGAIERLQTLDRLVGTPDRPPFNPERSALLGSAYKRQANLYALRLLAQERVRQEAGASSARKVAVFQLAEGAAEGLRRALEASISAYRRDECSAGSREFSAYLALNRLALDAITAWRSEAEKQAAIELAHECRRYAAESFGRTASPWDAMMQPEALLVERLVDGSLAGQGDAAHAALEELAAAYGQALANVTVKPSQLDSMLSQMELLSRFLDACGVAEENPAYCRVATRLLELLQRIRPGRPPRNDRPSMRSSARPAATAPAPAPVARKASARKTPARPRKR